jgi:hypothetical protein
VNPEIVNEAVGKKIPVQGRLTSKSGSPLNGDYSIAFRIYDKQTFGTPLCDETKIVSVIGGLFNTDIKNCTSGEINGQQLYLGVEVENDGEMKPRQPLYPVPYAYSLVQGAAIADSLPGKPMLTVANTAGSGAALMADGKIQSSKPTYPFIPGTAIKKAHSDTPTKIWADGGVGNLYKGSAGAGDEWFVLPILIPGVLYGQPVRITEARIYYVWDEQTSYIKETILGVTTGASTHKELFWQVSNQDSTEDTSYAPPINQSNNQLTADSGPLTMSWKIYFTGETPSVRIAYVRLTLEHD